MTSITNHCRVCRRIVCDADIGQTICNDCAPRYPTSLLKADSDQFEYACKLTDGTEIHFCSAKITGEFVTLYRTDNTQFENLPHSFPRGLDVRVDQILWCADAPDGS